LERPSRMACPALSPVSNVAPGAVGLAVVRCAYCHGSGWVPGIKGVPRTCACVARATLRICLRRYDYCRAMQGTACGVCHLQTEGPRGLVRFYAMRREEYMADVELTARRVLLPEEWTLFRLHMLFKLDWRACSRIVHLDRWMFFRSVYRVETKLGMAFAGLKPYSLLPAEYFKGHAVPPAERHWSKYYAMETEGRESVHPQGADAQPEAAMGACG